MKSIIQAAYGAETIALTDRNKQVGLNWLRAIGLDAPELAGRQLHRRVRRPPLRCR
jgi:hypothetical protein